MKAGRVVIAVKNESESEREQKEREKTQQKANGDGKMKPNNCEERTAINYPEKETKKKTTGNNS